MSFEPGVTRGNQRSIYPGQMILSVSEPGNALGVEAATEGIPGL